MFRHLILAGIILTLGCGSALAENSLVVQSKTVGMGGSTTVGVFLSNDVPVRGFTIPLVVREITPGVYPTALSMAYPIPSRIEPEGQPFPYLFESVFLIIYDIEDGTCKNGQPGGFATIAVPGGGLRYLEDPNPSSPDCLFFNRNRNSFPDLPAGSDGTTPSMAIGITAPNLEGAFDIDSTCKNPGGHLLFLGSANQALPFTFTKGVIEVIACECPYQGDYDRSGWCSSADCALLIDILFAGWPDVQDPICPAMRSDMDCDGFTTPLDLAYMIDYLWAGGQRPCDPCTEMTPPPF